MDHNEAIRSMAAEKYLLSELAPDLKEDFEEHFFECQDCGSDIRAGALFLEHSKAVLSKVNAPQVIKAADSVANRGWIPWLRALAVPAMAFLIVIVAFQNLATVPKLKGELAEANAPHILSSASLIAANSRGAKQLPITVRRGEPFLLFVDINPDKQFASYVAKLEGPTGAVEWSLRIAAEAAKETLPIQAPALKNAGEYTLVVSGVDAGGSKTSEVSRYPIELQFQN